MESNNLEKFEFNGDWTTTPAVSIRTAFDNAANDQHKLPEWVLELKGMSGKKYRKFVNNLLGSLTDVRYLEIGVWAGSTACAALYGNRLRAVCADNWSGFGGPKDLFFSNIDKLKSPDIDFSFIENDFRAIDYNNIGKFNCYMFDGPHSEQDQYDALNLAMPALDDEFIFIVDDWNYTNVSNGTMSAINNLKLNVIADIKILTQYDPPHYEGSDWHNGYGIFLIKK